MRLVDFAVQVWKGAGLLLGTGLLLYLGIAVIKTLLQEFETICDVLVLLVTKCKRQGIGAFAAGKRLWKALTTLEDEKEQREIVSPIPLRQSRSELPPGDVPAASSRSG